MTLTSQINWTGVFPLLDIRIETAVLPCIVSCPLCRGPDLLVVSDATNGGEWCYCRSCTFAGDLLQLVERCWNSGTFDTVSRLIAAGLLSPDSISVPPEYTARRDRYQKLTDLWTVAREAMAHDTLADLRAVRTRLRWRAGASVERRRNELGKFLGGVAQSQLVPLLGNKRRKMFQGAGWEQMFVIPFYDLPGRINGILCIGRPKGNDQRIFWSVGQQDAGLAGCTNLFEPMESEWDNAVFALDDIDLVLRLQGRNFEESGCPLPILSWYSGAWANSAKTTETGGAWQMLGTRSRILWSATPGPALYRQAKLANGLVARAGPDYGDWQMYFQQTSPREFLRILHQTARPWRERLAEDILRLRPEELDNWAAQLRWNAVEWQEFANNRTAEVREKLEQLTHRSQSRSVAMCRQTIVETGVGWQLLTARGEHAPELVSDTIIRVDQVLYQPRLDRTHYRGRLLRGEHETPFLDDLTKIEAQPLAWLRRTLMRDRQGIPRVQPGWESRLLGLALQFQIPETLTGPDRFGWDPATASILFPAFAIDASGCRPHPVICADEALLPGIGLLPPEPVGCVGLARITTDAPGIPLLAATTAAVVANLLAPAYGQQTCGIALVGISASHAAAAVARALGCPEIRIDRHDDKKLKKLAKIKYDHGWPLLVTPLDRTIYGIGSWLEQTPKNCLIAVAEHIGSTLWAQGNWHVLRYDGDVIVSPTEAVAIGRVFLSYLQDLCRRRLELQAASERPYVLRVLDDFRTFLERQGAETANWLPAEELLRPSSLNPDVMTALGETLSWLVHHGEVQQVREGFEARRASPELVYLESGSVFLSYAAVNRAMNRYGSPTWDIVQITEAAERDGILQGTGDYRGCDGWFLRKQWWDKQHAKWRSQKVGTVRIVG